MFFFNDNSAKPHFKNGIKDSQSTVIWIIHSQDASSIHSIWAGGYSLKNPNMSLVLISSTPHRNKASKRTFGMAVRKRGDTRMRETS